MRWWLPAALAVVLLAAACSKGSSLPPVDLTPVNESGDDEPKTGEELTRVAEADGVTVEATWLQDSGLGDIDADLSAYPLDKFLLVEMGFTTHSGDLSEIDMEQAASLRQEGVELRPAAWVSTSDDSHHRAGVLVFPRELAEGPVEMTLIVGGEEMLFRWAAAPKA